MKLEELENYTRVIAYDDDNHGIRIYVNGIYIDDMDNRVEAAVHLIKAGQDTARGNLIATADVYPCELEADDETIDRVHEVLRNAFHLTPEQEVAILNQNYEEL